MLQLLATTARELNCGLETVVEGMSETDFSTTSIKSASNLFRRFVFLDLVMLI